MATVVTLSKYSVTGRRFEGSLADPIRNDTEVQDYDNKSAALEHCRALVALGYRVWLYERSGSCFPASWHRVGEWREGEPVE